MRRLLIVAAILLSFARVASAHRLDEYLQATILTVDSGHLQASMRLIPGVAVSSSVIESIDADHNGVFSEPEQRAYAQSVLNDLSLTLDGIRLTPQLISVTFPEPLQLQQGLGEIHILFTADLPPGSLRRILTLENHHQNAHSVYLVNAALPTDPEIRITAQKRNELQSSYELDYEQVPTLATTSRAPNTTLLTRIDTSAFATLFRLGIHHIAEGTDHLLFLLTLLLPAPLIAAGGRWTIAAGTRRSLISVLKTVTAFTVGHSITLALAALGFVHVPSRPIEVLIALSILVSAIHAIRPIFPGKEFAIAAFFGLIHGLAFATVLNRLALGRWQSVSGILAFNLGIEAMQMAVVAAVLPSLILISRTNVFSILRVSAAILAALASVSWIVERLFNIATPVDPALNTIARHGMSIAAALFVISLAGWASLRTTLSATLPTKRQMQ